MMIERFTRLLSVCLLAWLAGCSAASGPLSGAHVLRIADTSDPDSLNPLLAHDQDTIGWDLLYCQTLVGLDAKNELVPVLVTRIPSRRNGDISRDGRSLTYHLRRNIRFADGVPLTSADVAFTYRAILDPRNNVLSQDAYRHVASLTTPDLHTVVIRLREPWNAATSVLFAQADFAFGILPAHAFSSTDVAHAGWGEHPFGTGPFRVVDWRRGDRIVLEPNRYYAPRPKLARIVMKMIPSTQTAFVSLRTHDVDLAVLTPEELAQAQAAPGLRILRTPENATVWFSLQTQASPTASLQVRHAIADALDVQALRKAYDGAYQPAGSFLPPVFTRWHDWKIAPRVHDPQRAAAELDEAGWHLQNGVRVKNGQPFSGVLVLIAGRAVDTRVATLVQEQLAQAGMRVIIKPFPTALFNAPDGPIRNGRYALSLDGWLGGADPEQSIVFACSQAGVNGNNITRYCDPAFDKLFADQQSTESALARRADYLRMQRIVRNDVPVVPLYYETYLEAASTRVTAFERNMLRYPVNAENWDVTP
ncbi:MAG: ABC transporter substrate-binding protein [Vulcanimicrobiaceae bacterium]